MERETYRIYSDPVATAILRKRVVMVEFDVAILMVVVVRSACTVNTANHHILKGLWNAHAASLHSSLPYQLNHQLWLARFIVMLRPAQALSQLGNKWQNLHHWSPYTCRSSRPSQQVFKVYHVDLFVFGDSQFDVGNNKYINTLGKANYWPYGETTFNYPSGRFCYGHLVPDFIAEYAKLPYIPPYLHPGIDQFIDGVNFASGGAGALVETWIGFVIDIKTQLGYFKNVSRLLRRQLGDAEAKTLLSSAAYLFGVGANDYVFPFETKSSVLQIYSVEQFVGQVIGNITNVIKIGGRKFGFPSLWPIECAPNARVFGGGNMCGCFERFTTSIELYNKQLSKLLQKLQNDLKGFKCSIPDFHTLVDEIINHPSKDGIWLQGREGSLSLKPYLRNIQLWKVE
ncbi:hypothetical protein FNV43_RR06642 [Rhamnella rubrinervis]|uniref:Uncharacterized protein n=1 Tax=Rhamnella rubrinervis TaxID=2594499 RepID=A0A8K0HEX7_9ROSA|nr:hypothetical protein FNV43_RR06642 [Rhamnella rubrinervis]